MFRNTNQNRYEIVGILYNHLYGVYLEFRIFFKYIKSLKEKKMESHG